MSGFWAEVAAIPAETEEFEVHCDACGRDQLVVGWKKGGAGLCPHWQGLSARKRLELEAAGWRRCARPERRGTNLERPCHRLVRGFA